MIDIEALEQKLASRERVTVVDVRGRDEYSGALGHIRDSLNIPLAELPGRLTDLQALKQQPLVLVCRTDKRSGRAAELLRGEGFGRVEVLRGGMEQWNLRSRPMEISHGKDPVHS